MNPKPERVPYGASHIRLRHYGHLIEKMIPVVADMEDGPERDEQIFMLANHMKKLMMLNNKEGVDDARIFRDLELYSDGKISVDPDSCHLYEFREVPSQQQGKKKRKK